MQNALCKVVPSIGMPLTTTSVVGGSGYTIKKHCVVTKTWRIMRLTAIFLLATGLSLSARTVSQTVTFTGTNVSLELALSAVKQQTGYVISYNQQLLQTAKSVTISAVNTPLAEFLSLVLKDQALAFSVEGKNVVLFAKPAVGLNQGLVILPPPITVRGRIVNEKGEPVVASVMIKGTKRGTTSDAEGFFQLNNVEENAELIISATNIETITTSVNGKTSLNISVKTNSSSLNEVVINKGYYTEKQRLSTGNVAKVDAKDIENQPVTSPLMALQGRMPGVDISPTSGAPGSAIKIQIRGLNSLRRGEAGGIDGNLPLYVIDGIPVMSAPVSANYSTSLMRGGFDPLSTVDPNNIESIQVLKDADATAIYGSRGANGVVLITTRMGSRGQQLHLDFGLYKGVGYVPNRIEMLDSRQYLDMRKEAIRNDGGEVQDSYENSFLRFLLFPDLLVWDSTRYTDWQEVLLGGTSHITDANINVSTGNATTTFSIGGSYHKETLLYPGDFGYKRYGANLNINHLSQDKKLMITFSGTLGVNSHDIFDNNQFYNNNFSLVPNAPALYDQYGALNWEQRNGVGSSTWANPLSWLRTTHESLVYNFLASSTASYQLSRNITIKLNSGFSKYDQQEAINVPISSLDPNTSAAKIGTRRQSMNDRISWIIEPQLNFERNYKEQHKVMSLIGMSFQQADNAAQSYTGTGYTSDAILGTLSGAKTITSQASATQYRYLAGYARFGYSFRDKYLFNLTGRRDGSSRFGPGKQYGNFGAIGFGWIFSEESFMNKLSPLISFGKIRFSYGITGNDQIDDYRYLKTYRGASTTYNGQIALVPTGLYNPEFAWEVTRKLEGAIETGLLKDRINLELAWYQNRSSNQLIQYQLPGISGFQSVLSNFGATVQNRGVEISVTSRNIVTEKFKWTTSANFTKASNELKSFPGIETSTYAKTFKVGEPINIQRGYLWTGVDPSTGIHTFRDLNDDGQITGLDQDFVQPLITNYFGGIMNSFNVKGFDLNFLIQFSDRIARTGYSHAPGTRNNQPINVLNRWQKPGDITNVEKFTTGLLPDGGATYVNWVQSSGSIENVNFWRLKTATISYTFSPQLLSRFGIRSLKLFVQGQNLLTSSSFDGWDPETLYGIPPLRIISGGIELKL